jgi:hypothetical protein
MKKTLVMLFLGSTVAYASDFYKIEKVPILNEKIVAMSQRKNDFRLYIRKHKWSDALKPIVGNYNVESKINELKIKNAQILEISIVTYNIAGDDHHEWYHEVPKCVLLNVPHRVIADVVDIEKCNNNTK